jgi:alpha-beta hydrolase superfamily lysophospholipase
VKISQNGSHLAAVRWTDGVPNLTIYNLNPGPGEESIRALSLDFSDSVEEKVRAIHWLGEGRIGVAVSPTNNADAIKVPVLLVHGEKDRVVDVSHSKLMAKRLKNNGKVHRLVLLPNGNHHRSREADSLRYLQEVEAFLAEHIGQ